MRSVKAIRRDLLHVALRAAAALFIIPALVWIFTGYVLHQQDTAFRAATEAQAGSAIESRAQALQAFKNTPPSSACSSSGDAALDQFRAQFCAPFSPQWQFVWANRISKITLGAGVLLMLACGALGLAAFRSRAAQYKSLLAGWRLLVTGSVAEILIQSVMLTWLAFWIPAWFWHKYFMQLIVLIAILAGIAAFSAIRQIFARPPTTTALEGEIITAQDAPALWARMGELAAKVGTAPPRHVIAGIDSNFFVTEGDLFVNDRTLRGRSLFVSLPLLRILDTDEADAVLAHELAHMSGGDTQSLAAIGPKLSQFDQYIHSMAGIGPTLIAFYLLTLYRIMLELALQKDSREREFIADLVAARHTSPGAIVRSLIKISGYSAYRARVEQDLFSRERKFDGEIGIAASVADGLRPFAYSADFIAHMAASGVPHPFDSHPSLSERMGSVGARVDESEYSAVLLGRAGNAWINDIPAAVHVEQRLWAGYEERFGQVHEQDLAYRYLPANDEERMLVEKFFPARTFALRRGRSVVVTFDAVALPAHDKTLAWDNVKNIGYEEGMLGDILTITLTEKGVLGSKTVKTRLWGIRARRDELRTALGQYWYRHRAARNLA